jgi:cobyrinic acid a,c-diamide synthase
MTARVLVIAGTASGVGKTTITLGLLEAYRRRGLRIQAFKVGPDFIDPGFHHLVTGRPSYNLDGWMCGRDWAQATVTRYAADAHLALIEGVMGCFDGLDATGEDGSTAQMAKWLGAPIALVLDASGQARSVAATVQGFGRFDPVLRIAAVIANRVGGTAHAAILRDALHACRQAELVGALPRDEALTLPERHLGLVTAREGPLSAEKIRLLGDMVEANIDLDRLLSLASPLSSAGFAGAADPGGRLSKGGEALRRVRIGVAHDSAFQFYYPDNLGLLRAAGAELVYWSPLDDGTLPDVDGLYFGGGYPELHARRLADNHAVLKAVTRHAEAGKPIYAECGGLMYLAETLEDMEGRPHRMVGLLPAAVCMQPRRLTLGYREISFAADCPLGAAGQVARGHEFHGSTLNPVPDSVPRVYRLRAGPGEERAEGYLIGRALLSYVHLHFGSNPALAQAFVASCAGRPVRPC